MAEIKDRETLEAWLKTQPREVCMAIAARAALRVLPTLARIPNLAIITREQLSRELLFPPLFFGASMPWFMAADNGHRITTQTAAAFSSLTTAAAETVRTMEPSDSAAVFAAFATSAAAASTATTPSAANAVAYAAVYAASVSQTIWRAINCDRILCEGDNGRNLVFTPLWQSERWPDGEVYSTPDWAVSAFAKLRVELHAENMDFDVWTSWYEARLHGGPHSLVEQRIRAGMEPEWFDKGAGAYNAELKRRLRDAGKWAEDEQPDEADSEIELPSVPESTIGPDWQEDQQTGLLSPEARPSKISEHDRADLMAQLPFLKDCVADLRRAVQASQSNSCAVFMPLVDKYDTAVGRAEADLSVDEIWSAGVRLRNAYERLRTDVAADSMPDVPTDIGEAFDSVIGLHGPMILSTDRGRGLDQRARDHNRTREQDLLYKEKAREFAQKVSASKGLVSSLGKDLVRDTAEEAASGPFPERSTAVSEGVTTSLTTKLAKMATSEVAKEVMKIGVIGGISVASKAVGLDPASAFLLTHKSFLLTFVPVTGELLAWLPPYLRWLERQARKLL